MHSSLHFTPLVSWPFLLVLIFMATSLFAFSAFYYKRGTALRSFIFGLFMLILFNPSILREDRNYTKDVAAIIVDESMSQQFARRSESTQEALSYLQAALQKESDLLDLRIIHAPHDGALSNSTELFSALDKELSDIPSRRRAGVVFISDGIIHDIPQNIEQYKDAYGPVHLLLTGEKNEKDRRISVINASAYGLVGKSISVTYKIEDTPNIMHDEAKITIGYNDGMKREFYVRVNEEQTISLPVNVAGENMFTLSVDSVANEITQANNRAALLVNGVRDRLKVLLISGVPHSGERTWRDLLTSDPGVDLVHFTILRDPQQLDYTPRDELSLIAFPFNELFNLKLHDFDLVIFDQYRVNNILPDIYFQNIVRYVRAGGAFLSSNGPAFAGRGSIYDTPLREILPARPTGNILEDKYVPKITTLGHKHPVTRNMFWDNRAALPGGNEPWGGWLRYIDIKAKRGDILMNAHNDKPLLILDRVDKGRVAQLSSDHIWLWSRGYDGGGPHAELLRRIVHWLMKEPELDECSYNVRVNKNVITVEKQRIKSNKETISMQKPDGEIELITLKEGREGTLSYKLETDNPGIYTFEDVEGIRKFAIIGDLNPPELDKVVASEEPMRDIINATGGTVIRLSTTPKPSIYLSGETKKYGSSESLALRRNNDYTITSVQNISLLREWASILILLCALMFVWWKEGHR